MRYTALVAPHSIVVRLTGSGPAVKGDICLGGAPGGPLSPGLPAGKPASPLRGLYDVVQLPTVEGAPADKRDDAGFEAVARREARHLFGIAYTILRDPVEAEDAVQDVLVRAWRAWRRTDRFADQGPWLTRICVNRSLSRRLHLRRLRTRETALHAQVMGHDPEPFDPELARAFDGLTSQQRAVVMLHYFFGYSLDESAEIMGCRPGTARSHLHRALVALREVMSR